jgi:hypothetical protein
MSNQVERIKMIDLKENQLFTYKPTSTSVFSAQQVKELSAGVWEVEYRMLTPKRSHFSRTIRLNQMVYVHARPVTKQVCRVCGCSDEDACMHPSLGNCWWMEWDLCSHCVLVPGESKRYSELIKANKSMK